MYDYEKSIENMKQDLDDMQSGMNETRDILSEIIDWCDNATSENWEDCVDKIQDLAWGAIK